MGKPKGTAVGKGPRSRSQPNKHAPHKARGIKKTVHKNHSRVSRKTKRCRDRDTDIWPYE